MKAKEIVGRKIVKVSQELWKGSNVGAQWVVTSITLDDGSMLTFGVLEGDGEYGVQLERFIPKNSSQ